MKPIVIFFLQFASIAAMMFSTIEPAWAHENSATEERLLEHDFKSPPPTSRLET